MIDEYSERIIAAATDFDLDANQTGSDSKNSKFDQLVKSLVLLKGLENDSIYFVEGQYDKPKNNLYCIDPIEFKEELMDKLVLETVSDGDHEDEMEDKIDSKLCYKRTEKPGIFERSKYMKSIFPSAQIQKPGYDYYGFTTLVLPILAIFVLYSFDKINT